MLIFQLPFYIPEKNTIPQRSMLSASLIHKIVCMLFLKRYFLFILFQLLCATILFAQSSNPDEISLTGTWYFKLDSNDVGEQEQWFDKNLNDEIKLPGSLTTNNIGDNI